jgi:hypothetical protein
MLVSVHIADVGGRTLEVLRRRPDPAEVPGLSYAETVTTASLGRGLLPKPQLGRIGLIAAWQDDEALDSFLRSHPVAARLASGWRVRLAPLRVSGSWSGMPGLPTRERAVDGEEPVAVLTLGRLRLNRAMPFLQSAAAAEGQAVADPALLASIGFARPPRLVSTFSLWRSATAMRAYAYGREGAHQAAVRNDRARPFHHESAFVRLRPYASEGSWDGRDPLAERAAEAS